MVIFYWLFAALTNLVYSFISPFFVLIDDLSKYYFFDIINVEDFKNKIYVILGVLMLFKLVISAVQYLVNPDSLGDKSKGLGNILKKTIICVALLVLVPAIFEFSIKVQTLVIEQIPTVILGNGTDTNSGNKVKDLGTKISTDILRSVLQSKNGRSPNKLPADVNSPSDFFAVATNGCTIRLGNIFEDLFWADSCNYDFMLFIALPIGIFMIFLLISLAIDIAIRTIKYGLVELLSPISIAGYITDDKKLTTWAQTAGQIYADLFIRMAIIYFVIFFLEKVLNSVFASNGYPAEFSNAIGRTPEPLEIVLIKVFIVIALLLFAKNAPKFICDLLGIKGADESIGNMFKRAAGMLGATTALPGRFTATRRNEMNKLAEKYGDGKAYNEMTRKERRDMIKKAAADGKHPHRHTLANSLRAAGAGYANAMYESVAHNKGYNEARSSARSAADRSYGISKAIDDKGITREQYRHAVHEQRRGIESSYAMGSEEAKGARAIADAAKASLDLAHNQLIDKNGDAQLTAEYISTLYGLNSDKFANSLKAAMSIDIKDKNGASIFKADMKDVMTGGKYTLGDVQKTLQSIATDTSGKYDAMTQRRAQTQLDAFNGEVDKFIHGQEMIALANGGTAPGSGVKHNPALANSMQNTADTFGTYASTPFGKAMIQEGIRLGIIDPENQKPKLGLEGVWYNMIKGKGLDEERETKAAMGPKELAAMSADEIAKQFDNKKS